MKLTKLQRYTVYCILLEESENPQCIEWHYVPIIGNISTISQGFCRMCDMLFGQRDSDYDFFDMLDFLPELKSKGCYNYATGMDFIDWKQRIAALKECIKETEPK